MDDCLVIDSALYGAGGAAPGQNTGTQIQPPTAADQIPVSVQTISGSFIYEPRKNPILGLTASDSGKALIVDATDPQNIVFKTAPVVVEDEALQSLLDNTGIIDYPELTFSSPNILKVPAFKAVFYSGTPGVRQIVDIPATDVTITRSGTGTPGDDFTYVSVASDGSFTQADTAPTQAQRRTELFLCEVFHPDGGPIQSVRPFYAFYGNNQRVSQELGIILGLQDRGFTFSRTAATGVVSQNGPDAVVLGYNIAATGDDRNRKVFPTGNITVEYYSFNPADRVANLTNFNKTYNLDNPAAGTSAALPNFGIITFFAGVDGSYVVVAPQKNFANVDDAITGRASYVGDLVLPKGFLSFYVAVATAIVSPTVTATTGTFDMGAIGDVAIVGGAAVGSGASLPDPASGSADDIVAVNAQADAYVLKDDGVPDLTGFADGSFLQVQGGQIVATPNVNAAYAGALIPRTIVKFFILEFNNGTFTGASGDTAAIDTNRIFVDTGNNIVVIGLKESQIRAFAFEDCYMYLSGTQGVYWASPRNFPNSPTYPAGVYAAFTIPSVYLPINTLKHFIAFFIKN